VVSGIGRAVNERISNLLYALGFAVEVFRAIPEYLSSGRTRARILVAQVLFTGVEALAVVAALSAAIGAVIIIQGFNLLPALGQEQLIFVILIAVITREFGPILTAFIVVARSGTAITTELGHNVVSHEIEAYLATGINPISFLVVPRLLGVTISVVLLNIYFNVFGLLGSYAVSQFVSPIAFDVYVYGLFDAVTLTDLFTSVTKSLVFGVIIALVATYHGFAVARAATEIPQRAIRSVGHGVVLCILANTVITLVSYL